MKRLVAAFLVLMALPAAAHAKNRSLTDGAWSYFGDPRAVYAKGSTYLGWITSGGHEQIGRLDSKGHFSKVTIDFMGHDDHNNPSLYMRTDGRLVAFYTAHTATYIPRSRVHKMFYRIASKPYSISSWGSIHTISANTPPAPGNGDRGFTYPNPVRMGNRVWLFWRGGSWWPTMSYTSDFVHWSKPRNVVSATPGQRPYTKVAGDGSTAYLAFTEAHPGRVKTSIYFLKITAGGRVLSASGRQLGTIDHPVSYKAADRIYHYRSDHGRSWIMDVAVGTDGNPVVVYFRRDPNIGDQYHYARWNGDRWVDRPIVAAGGTPLHKSSFYQSGATLDHEDPTTVYLSRKRTSNGHFEVEIWTTPDEGRTWGTVEVTKNSPSNNWRPVSPRGSDGYKVFFFQGSYLNFRNYNTDVIVGAKRRAR